MRRHFQSLVKNSVFQALATFFIPVLSPFHIFGLVLTFVKGFISSRNLDGTGIWQGLSDALLERAGGQGCPSWFLLALLLPAFCRKPMPISTPGKAAIAHLRHGFMDEIQQFLHR